MGQPDTATSNQLANALNALGVNFILCGSGADVSLRHKELSGSFTNWLGTYQHTAQVWRKVQC